MFPAPFSYGGSFAHCDSLHLLNAHCLTEVGGKWFLMKYYMNYELMYYALCVCQEEDGSLHIFALTGW